MRMNTRRYQVLLSEAVEACLPEPDADLAERDVLDVLLEQRLQRGDGEQVSTPACTRLWSRVTHVYRALLRRHVRGCSASAKAWQQVM